MKFWERMAFLERASVQKEKGCKFGCYFLVEEALSEVEERYV